MIGRHLRRIATWSWPRAFPIVQFPNPPLGLALLASLATGYAHGEAHRWLRAIFYLALGVWAYEEARHGVNWFRRALGAGFLIYLTVTLAAALRT